MDETLEIYKSPLNLMNTSSKDIENSLNSALIHNSEKIIKKYREELYLYKYITKFLLVISLLLTAIIVFLILNIKIN
jgi:hypothetical protein